MIEIYITFIFIGTLWLLGIIAEVFINTKYRLGKNMKGLKLIDVNSSMIRSMGYSYNTQRLYVTFTNGDMGFYKNVPDIYYEELKQVNTDPDKSFGKTFNRLIRTNKTAHPFTAVKGDK